jgi:hypothetical protein
VFILKTDKVLCFDTLLQVLILRKLRQAKCTKIVQSSRVPLQVLQTKDLVACVEQPSEKQNADKLPALQGGTTRIYKSYYTVEVPLCQEKPTEEICRGWD